MHKLGYVDIERDGELVLASVVGEIDLSNARDLDTALHGAISNATQRVVIDLSQTEYFDSVGIRSLFTLAENAQSRRQEVFLVVPETSRLRRLFELVDLGRVLSMVPDRAAAGV